MQRGFYIGVMVVLALLSAAVAFFSNRTAADSVAGPNGAPAIHDPLPPEQSGKAMFLHILRAFCCLAIFLSFCILTGNGPTCLFPNKDGTGTLLHQGVGTAVSGILAAVFAAMAVRIPNFVI